MPRLLKTKELKDIIDPDSVWKIPDPVSVRIELPDDAWTTVHIGVFPKRTTAVRVAAFPHAERLLDWCERTQIHHAMVGGFFKREHERPFGEVWMHGMQIPSTPYDKKWGPHRGTLLSQDMGITIAPRRELPKKPTGDLLQSGPMLVRDGKSLIKPGVDPEGLRETHPHDTDWTKPDRYMHSAIGYDEERIWAVVSDGQQYKDGPNGVEIVASKEEAGLTLIELAEVMIGLGADRALKMDGGGSTTLVHNWRLINEPKAGIHDDEPWQEPLKRGRPIHSAIAFLPR